jgi:hypothetical protein
LTHVGCFDHGMRFGLNNAGRRHRRSPQQCRMNYLVVAVVPQGDASLQRLSVSRGSSIVCLDGMHIFSQNASWPILMLGHIGECRSLA